MATFFGRNLWFNNDPNLDPKVNSDPHPQQQENKTIITKQQVGVVANVPDFRLLKTNG